MSKPIQFDPAKADELAAVFRTWLTGSDSEKRSAKEKLREACVLVIGLPNPRFVTRETHWPCHVFDANGLQWNDMLWVDLETGEGEQAERDEHGVRLVRGVKFATRIVQLATPVLVKPIKEPT